MHPLSENLSVYTDVQIEEKLSKLNRIYFLANDQYVRHQIILLIDTYKVELVERRERLRQKQIQEAGRDDLDNLINVS